MKENEDEYKFLGYESHIKEVLTEIRLFHYMIMLIILLKHFII